MKKIVFSFLFMISLFADSFKVYSFLVKENYKEYSGDFVLDRDYSSFSDIKGLGIEYERNFYFFKAILNGEFANGNSTYDGYLQNGIPVKYRQSGVKIYNVSFKAQKDYFYLILGYRLWKRGNSNTPGNYNEDYYWKYWGIGWNLFYKFENLSFNYLFQYQNAINPKMKVYLGNKPTLNLGYTGGVMGKVSIDYNFDEFRVGMFYKIDVWVINSSEVKTLIVNNQSYKIFEPDSITRNQYIGIYIQKSF